MRRTTASVAALLGALVAVGTSVSLADARPRSRAVDTDYYTDTAPPLTVNRRSFLDPGPVVPPNSQNNYVTSNTIFNKTPDQVFAPSQFGNASLPQPLEVPGRNASFYEFDGPALDD